MTQFKYQCTECHREFQRDDVTYLCPDCSKTYAPGMPLRGVLQALFDYDYVRAHFNPHAPDWDLFSAVEQQFYPEFPVGNTPFFQSTRLGGQLGFTNLRLKNDGLNPSGSLKDRASFLIVAEAIRKGIDTIVTASTGNAASALAAVCAAAGKQAVIFVPESAPKPKLVQIMLSGARIIPVKGTYDDAFRLSLEYTNAKGGLNRNTAYHPLTIEGKKTVGLEIFQQNGLRAPDVILVPVGDGVIISGVYKAFYDLHQAGLIQKLPKLICVQAEASNAIHRYITTGIYANAAHPATIADSISVAIPSNAHMARRAVNNTGGFSLTVSDAEILDAQALLASITGIFAEPSAAATVAGLLKCKQEQLLKADAQIVLLITGHGLKDVDAPMGGMTLPEAVLSIDEC
ncbi:threonine synthase [candidate division KSB1 bacterium]|nr:threonine synthase [candidate division KSB1 bacterium]